MRWTGAFLCMVDEIRPAVHPVFTFLKPSLKVIPAHHPPFHCENLEEDRYWMMIQRQVVIPDRALVGFCSEITNAGIACLIIEVYFFRLETIYILLERNPWNTVWEAKKK